MIDDPLSTAEASLMLGVHPCTMRRWRMEHTGPKFHRCGYRSFWYSRADVAEFAALHYSAAAARMFLLQHGGGELAEATANTEEP